MGLLALDGSRFNDLGKSQSAVANPHGGRMEDQNQAFAHLSSVTTPAFCLASRRSKLELNGKRV